MSFDQFLEAILLVTEAYQRIITEFYEARQMNLRRNQPLLGKSLMDLLTHEVLENRLFALLKRQKIDAGRSPDLNVAW